MKTSRKTSWLGIACEQREPTSKYRPAIWENMLGTVFAMNDARKIKYFGYRHDEAKAFAGVLEDGRDCRVAEWKGVVYDSEGNLPRRGQRVLWCIEK